MSGSVQWVGELFPIEEIEDAGQQLISMKTLFRTTGENMKYLKAQNLIPDQETEDTALAHGVQGQKVKQSVEHVDSLLGVEDIMVGKICDETLAFNKDKNVHPGHVAILFPDDDYKILFANSPKTVIDKINKKIIDSYDKAKKDITPSFTTEVEESILFDHEDDLKQCRCSFFLGNVSNVKGITIPIVHFMQIVLQDDAFKMISTVNPPCTVCKKYCSHKMETKIDGRPGGSRKRSSYTDILCINRTWPQYLALSRCSSEFLITNLEFDEILLKSFLPQLGHEKTKVSKLISNVMAPRTGESSIQIQKQAYTATVECFLVENISYISWHPSQNLLATLSKPGFVQIWEVSREECNEVKMLEQGNVTSLAWSPTGVLATLVKTTTQSDVHIWSSNGELEIVVDARNADGVIFSKTGVHLLAWSKEATSKICVWRTADWTCLGSIGKKMKVDMMYRIGRIGRKSLDWRNDNMFSYGNSNLGMTNVTITPEGLTEEVMGKMPNNVFSIKWDSDGDYLAIGGTKNCYIWSAHSNTWQILDTTFTNSAMWSPAPATPILATVTDEQIVLYNAGTGQILHTLTHTDSDVSVCVTFSPDGRFIASAGKEAVKVWSVDSGDMVGNIRVHGNLVCWGHNKEMAVLGHDRVHIFSEEQIFPIE